MKPSKEEIILNISKQNIPKKTFLIKHNITSQECYDILNDITTDIPKCFNYQYCGNHSRFKNFIRGYAVRCEDQKCKKILRVERMKKTNLEKYGVENISQLDNIKEKKKNTYFERYGVYDYLNSEMNRHNLYNEKGTHKTRLEEANEKRNKTLLEKYGTIDTLSLKGGRTRGLQKCNNDESVKEKRQQTCYEKYGGETSFHSNEVQNKVQDTLFEKYGAITWFASEEGREFQREMVHHRKNLIHNCGLNDYQISAQKAKQTNIKNGIWLQDEYKSPYLVYKQEVWKHTRSWDLTQLEHHEKRGHVNEDGFHLDHMYSIKQGFVDNVSPKIIGHIQNLEFIYWRDNLSKHQKSSTALEELLYRIEEYERNEN